MAGLPTALSMGLSGDNLNLGLPEKDVLAFNWLIGKTKDLPWWGLRLPPGSNRPTSRSEAWKKSWESLGGWDRRRHHLIQYFPLTVEYTKAQRAVHLPPAPPDLLSTVLHAVLYSGRLPCVHYIRGFPYPLAFSSVRPQGSTHRRSEGKERERALFL